MASRAATGLFREIAREAAAEARRRGPQIRESIQQMLRDEQTRKNAASKIQGAFKAFKRRKGLKHRMAPEAVTSTRQRGILINDEKIALRTLFISSLSYPASGNGVGERLGSTIKMAGLKVCEQFHNDNDFPIVIHWALLQQRRNKALNSENFFRDTTSAVDRSLNFSSPTAGGNSPYSFAYDCYPINPDEFYILDHRKKVLSGENADVRWDWDTWKFEKYYKLNVKFTFDGALDSQPQKPIIRVMWWQPLRSTDWPNPQPTPLPSITRNAKAVTYFRPNFA